MNRQTAIAVACVFATVSIAASALRAQAFKLPNTEVGTEVNLTGKWNFKPHNEDKEVQVPVPQMLNRIQWWLDDSEDFKKWEQARLDALGFDTEKSDEGEYRAIIDLPELPKDRHIWIEFDGVAMKCKTFINGQELGAHEGMFSRFSYDLTPHLKAGKNELKVWVSMEKQIASTAKLGEAVTVNLSASKVVSMSKGMFGPLSPNQKDRDYDLYGIWQPVKLVVRGDAKIEDVFFHSSDKFQSSSVDVDLSAHAGENVTVTATFSDPKDATKPGGLSRDLVSQGKDHVVLAPLHGDGVNVKLWTPADPNLYRLDVTLKDKAGNLLDTFSQNVGFRTFEIKGNQLYLNGHRYWLRGANQLPYGKNPWDPALAKKLIQLLHDGNERFTRTHATPWNEAWLNAADEIGLAVSIEGIRPWALAGKTEEGEDPLLPPPAIYQQWLTENADVVKRCRNHPSVFLWTVGNEMNLRDGGNLEKWKLLSGVVKNTRENDHTRPVVSSSSYVREQKQYKNDFIPNQIDDGDIDDLHDYNAWYGNSNFVYDTGYNKQMKENQKKRPFIGQEISTGYPDLDTGLPVLRYTKDLLTPQAWVGEYAYPGNDPTIWLDHHAKVTKRWAEMLRYQRGDNNAGFCMFSAECWFHHSYEPGTVTPYPVYNAMKQAFAPIGLAVETGQRRFWADDKLKTNVFITNDDEQFRDYENLELAGELQQESNNIRMTTMKFDLGKLDKLAYYQTVKLPIEFNIPALAMKRLKTTLVIRLMQGKQEIARTSEAIEFFQKRETLPATAPSVTVIKHNQPLAGLADGQPLRQQIEQGATAIVFAPNNAEIAKLFPEALYDDAAETARQKKEADAKAATRPSRHPTTKKSSAKPASAPAEEKRTTYVEFADFAPCLGTKLAENLQPMDLKWWAREKDWRTYIGHSSERLKPTGPARELIRYIPPHGYIAEEKVPEQYRTVLCEIPLGKGRLWICNLDIDASAKLDPAANLFAENLYKAAADPDSTKSLPKVPTHEELLKGK